MSKKPKTKIAWETVGLYGLISVLCGVGLMTTEYYMNRKKSRHEIDRLEGELLKIRDERHMYIMKADEIDQNKKMQKTADSLNARNAALLIQAQQDYLNKTDNFYTLGKFFSPAQIAQMNKIVKTAGIKFDAGTSLADFQEMLSAADISANKFTQFGVILDGGYIHMFNDSVRQKMFTEYLDANDAAFVAETDEDIPNPDVIKDSRYNDEYKRNQDSIRALDERIASNKATIEKNLAQFDVARDSLNRLVEKKRQVLK